MSGLRELPWDHWRRQVLAVMRLEMRKSFLGRRAILLYLFAFMPLFPLSLMVLVTMVEELPEPVREVGATAAFATIVFDGNWLAGFILKYSLFLGCVWIFMNLFRGEVLDRSLHYYFLAPIRRSVLLVAKFLSGWLAASILYGLVTAASFVILHLCFGIPEAQRYFFGGPGLAVLFGYVVVTAIACLGYGAVFVLTGLFFRNPIVPALLIWIWELLNPIWPAALKKISVIHYLRSLAPVKVSEGPLAIVADPTPFWIAFPGLLIFSLIVLALARLRIRTMEVQYAGD
jgi:ABC-type transport system involved in multi-copper enzyme maturation permease subunit